MKESMDLLASTTSSPTEKRAALLSTMGDILENHSHLAVAALSFDVSFTKSPGRLIRVEVVISERTHVR